MRGAGRGGSLGGHPLLEFSVGRGLETTVHDCNGCLDQRELLAGVIVDKLGTPRIFPVPLSGGFPSVETWIPVTRVVDSCSMEHADSPLIERGFPSQRAGIPVSTGVG